jgi:hypothetical protein
MIDHDPAYGGSRFERGLVEQQAGRMAEANAEFALARKYWASADADLPQLKQMRNR